MGNVCTSKKDETVFYEQQNRPIASYASYGQPIAQENVMVAEEGRGGRREEYIQDTTYYGNGRVEQQDVFVEEKRRDVF